MKLTAVLTLLTMLQMQAAVYSQNSNFNISVENKEIRDVLKELEQNSDFRFFYSEDFQLLNKRVKLTVTNASMQSILDRLLENSQLTYRIFENKLVVIVPSNDIKQGIKVTGTITDANGTPLPGVNIVEVGTTNGAVTDLDGNYSITVSSEDAVLRFSFVGYLTEEIEVGGQTKVDITLVDDIQALDEVVVVGYGTQRRVNLTGSVGVATAERLENRPITSAGRGLQGVIPNLNISYNTGDPAQTATINVRGFESINGGSPLILIDGVPGELDKLNPNDIESVTVLKDAAAAAVYGARAAFGVVLVQTKKGQPGKMKVTLATEQSATVPIALIDPENDPYKAALIWNQVFMRTRGKPRFDEDYLEGFQRWNENPTFENEWGVYQGNLRKYSYTDYKGMTIADWSHQQKYDLNISGASDKTSYYASFGFIDKEGWAELPRDKNYMYKRYNVLMKGDLEITDWLTMDSQINWSAEHNDEPHYYGFGASPNSVARVDVNHLITFPDLPYYLEPGDRENYEPYIGKYFLRLNAIPYWENGGRNVADEQRLLMKQGLTISPVKGLLMRGDFSYSTYHRERQDVASKIEGINNTDLTNLQIGNGFSGNDWIQNWSNYNQYYVMNAYAEYTYEELADHYIKAMVGFNQEWGMNTYVGARAANLITPLITDISATTGTQQTYGSRSHQSLRGIFYRFNYSFRDKYLLEVNGRYDGTSRFPTDDRFDFFPSVSAAWRLSNEPFMATASNWLDNLKLRVSYGSLGNQLLNDLYPYIPSMGTGTSPYMMSSAGRIPYVSPAGLISPSLTWETVETKNIGLDFTMLNQRLDVVFDVFQRDTKDMLMEVDYPSLLGTSAPASNAADLRTQGWELAVTWRDRIGQDWRYGLTLALADNQSEITKYDNPTGALSEWREGQKVGEIWGYVTEGIFQTDEEVAQHADQSSLGSGWQAGDMKYMDLNGDGKINAGSNTIDDPGDRQVIGNSTERYTFGLNPDIQYKDWTLNLFFQGRMKRDYLPSGQTWAAFYPFNAGHIEKWYMDESWSPDNPDAYFYAPQLIRSDKKNIQPQSRFLQNAAYMRLKNITLSYWLPETLAQKAGMSRAQIYLSGMNLFTITDMHKPLDPEQTGLLEIQQYYFDKVYSLGVKVTF